MPQYYCPACGHPRAADALFCGRCGGALPILPLEPPAPFEAPVQPDPTRPPPTKQQPREETPWYAFLIVGMLLAMAASLVALLILLIPGLLPPRSAFPTSSEVADAITNTVPSRTETPTPAETPSPANTLVPPVIAAVPTTTRLQPTRTPRSSPTASPTIAATPGSGPELWQIGLSARGTPIEAFRIGNGPRQILFVGGIHAGHSPGSVALARQAADYFSNNSYLVPEHVTLTIVFSLNPDSLPDVGRQSGRLNANRVDLNRNFGCDWVRDADIEGNIVLNSGGEAPFSEPETQALRDLIEQTEPAAVIFWEASFPNGLSSPGGCLGVVEVSRELAETYGRAAGYRVANYEDVDRPIQGDASNWLDSQRIPAIFVLLPNFTNPDWESNLAGILAVLRE